MGINLWITTPRGGEMTVDEPSARGSGGDSSTGAHPAVDDGGHMSHPSAMRSTCMIFGSTPTEPARRADPRIAPDGMRLEHGRADDGLPETASRRNGRHSGRMHRNLERPGGTAFPNSSRPSPDVMAKGDSRGRTQDPRPCRRSTASAAPGARGILVGPASPPAAHPRRPRIPVGPTAPTASRRRAPLRAHTEGRRGGTRRRRGGPRRRRLVSRCRTDPALRPSGTGRRGVPQDRDRRGSSRRRRAGARGRSRRGRVPGARRGRCR